MSAFDSKKIVFSGCVQGVGFRFTTNEIAAKYNLVGWVRNRSDGKVEMAVRGTAAEIDRIVDEIANQSGLAKLIDCLN